MNDFDVYATNLNALAVQLSGPTVKRVLDEIGSDMQAIAENAASSDLGGDPRFSGWAAPLTTRLKREPGLVRLQPEPRSSGPWTVAQSGRNAGGTGALRTTRSGQLQRRSGTRLRKTDGVRVDKWRRTAWNGTTQGKGTADSAVRRMEVEVPKKLQTVLVREAAREAGFR